MCCPRDPSNAMVQREFVCAAEPARWNGRATVPALPADHTSRSPEQAFSWHHGRIFDSFTLRSCETVCGATAGSERRGGFCPVGSKASLGTGLLVHKRP